MHVLLLKTPQVSSQLATNTTGIQQEEEDVLRFGLAPRRGRPKPPEKLKDESEIWLKE